MRYLLDANVLIDLANEGDTADAVAAGLDRAGAKNCALSAITVEELQRGVLTGPGAKKGYEVRNLKALLSRFRQLDFTADAARRAASVRVQIENLKPAKGRRPPGINDMLLAGHALALGRSLVTSDHGFALVPDLISQNWRIAVARNKK